MSGLFSDNPNYREYERLLMLLHDLNASGQNDSDEADVLRDQMDGPWRSLSAEEVERLDGLSADLYMLSDEEVVEKADPVERGPDTLGIALSEARRRGDWAQILQLLRKGPTFFPTATIAFLRGLGYLQLGHPQVALRFFDHAAKLTPDEDSYLVSSLGVLKRLGKHDEALARAKRYLANPNAGLSVAVHSMSEVFRSTHSISEAEAAPIYEGLIGSLAEKLGRNDRAGGEDPQTVAFGYLLLGACLESVGRYDQALAAYDSSTAIDPLAQHTYIAKSALLEKMREAAEISEGPAGSATERSARSLRHRENRFKIVLNAEPPPVAA